MSTFQVPQFIDEKAKIIGPFTLIQFLYLTGAGIISLIAFYTFGFFLWVLATAVAAGLAISLAFVEINGQGLPSVIKSAALFWQKPKTYVWKKEIPLETLDVSALEKIEALRHSISLQEKIKTVALAITTGKALLFSGKKRPKPKSGYQTATFIGGEKRRIKKVNY